MRKLVFIFLLLYTFNGFAQTPDSIHRVLASGAPYAEKMKTVIQFTGDYSQIGKGKEVSALCREGIALAEEQKDSISIAILTRNMANALYFQGAYDSAATGYYTSAAIFEKSGSRSELAATYNSLGRLFRKTKDLDRAMLYYNQAMAIYQGLGDRPGVATIYNESGVVFEYRGDYDEAIRRYTQALQIHESMKDSLGKSYALNFLAGVYTIKKDFRKAEDYLNQVITLRRQLRDTFGMALAYTDLGVTLSMKGDPVAATGYFMESNKIAKRMGYKELIMNNYTELATAAVAQGNYKDAYDFVQQKTAIRDSLFTLEKTKQIEELNTRYETAIKEQTIEQQNHRLTRQRWLIGGIIVLLLFGALYANTQYRKYKLKKEKQLQEELFRQQQIAASEVIAAEENERKRIASELHDGVGQMMSAARMNLSAFENSFPFSGDDQNVAFEKIIGLVDDSAREIRNVSHNLMPIALQKKGLVEAVKEFTSKIDRNVLEIGLHTEDANGEPADLATANILYRVIQECVNNVLKHAEATRVDIVMDHEGDDFSVTIEDNGRGFDTAKMSEEGGGLGLGNIKSRVDYLRGTVEFDSAPGRGTVVMIHIPLK